MFSHYSSDVFSDTISDYGESQQDISEGDNDHPDLSINTDAYIVIDSVPPYRRIHRDDIIFQDDMHAKPVFKKKVSQMGRRKANRAQNGILIYMLLLCVKYPKYYIYGSIGYIIRALPI